MVSRNVLVCAISVSFFLAPIQASAAAGSISITQNPIQVCDSSGLGIAEISATADVNYEIRVGSAGGALFASKAAGDQAVQQTGKWVSNGMVFYLVDTATHDVLATVTASLSSVGCISTDTVITATPSSIQSCIGFADLGVTTIRARAPVDFQIRIGSPTGTIFQTGTAHNQIEAQTGQWVTDGMTFYLVATADMRVLGTVRVGVTSAGCPIPPGNNDSPLNSIRSVTWYTLDPYVADHRNLRDAIPRIKNVGFNAVWLVTPWMTIQPNPLRRPIEFNEDNVAALKETLSLLRANSMRAVIGLDYLGPGWAPEGIDACNWVKNAPQYAAFVDYASELMRRLDGFEDVVIFHVFTENAVPCGMHPFTDRVAIATLLRPTLGSFPSQLPSALRNKFVIGYHDQQIDHGNDSPVQSPNQFDFMSMGFYHLENKSTEDVVGTVHANVGRMKALYPDKPVVIGEIGASACSSSDEDNQRRVVSTIVRTAMDLRYGFNVWNWSPVLPNECSVLTTPEKGFYITRDGTSLRPLASTLKDMFASILPLDPTPTPVHPVFSNCSFNGRSIAHGASVTAFDTSSAINSASCRSEMRTCMNGTLSGTYAFSQCSISSPPSNPTSPNIIPPSGTTTLSALLTQIAALKEQLAFLTKQNGSNVAIRNESSRQKSCVLITRTLMLGSRGDDVARLQSTLIALGILEPNSVTGYFGMRTQAAVQSLQASMKLVMTGSPKETGYGAVGPRTRKVLSCTD